MNWREKLQKGVVIPAHPLALNAERKLDERRQRALTRYYLDAGAGGHGLGQVGRPSDAGKGLEARENAELTNAIQRFFLLPDLQ